MCKYTEAVERNLEGLTAVSTGPCPGCAQCASDRGYDFEDESDREVFHLAWQAGAVDSEGSFSWCPCGICGTRLGGNREEWHAIRVGDSKREILHFSDACTDCVMYLANGDLPEQWRASANDEPEDCASVDNPGRY